jgi:hypothetical protein
MASLPYSSLKQFLGRQFSGLWSTTDVKYAGFGDPEYEILTLGQWADLVGRCERAGYKDHVYDCEDIAMEFKAYVSKLQGTDPLFAAFDWPFAIGIATGHFLWVDDGNTYHAANFAVLEDDVDTYKLEWFDLRTCQTYPAEQLIGGLVWTLV